MRPDAKHNATLRGLRRQMHLATQVAPMVLAALVVLVAPAMLVAREVPQLFVWKVMLCH
jgi:hypothetical protein